MNKKRTKRRSKKRRVEKMFFEIRTRQEKRKERMDNFEEHG